MDNFIKIYIFLLIFVWGFAVGWNKPCHGAEFYTVATLKSYHQDREHGYNEKNLGIGLELSVNEDWRLLAGEYKNSFRDKSQYAGFGWFPFHRGNWSAGTFVLEVSGYEENLKKFMPVAAPIIEYKKDRFLVNILIVPPIHKDGIVAVQAGWNFF